VEKDNVNGDSSLRCASRLSGTKKQREEIARTVKTYSSYQHKKNRRDLAKEDWPSITRVNNKDNIVTNLMSYSELRKTKKKTKERYS